MGEIEGLITDTVLRENHAFVMVFETLRKRHGYREMSDAALADIARVSGVPFEKLRVARHLRNALAHGDPVNRDALRRAGADLGAVLGEKVTPVSADAPRREARALRVHAWLDERLEQEMLANGFVSVGGDEIGDLTAVDDLDLIRQELTRTMPDRKPQAIRIFVGYWERFLEAEPGSICALPTRGGTVAIGEFVGPYHYVANAEPRARHRRNIGWLTLGVDRSAFSADLTTTIQGRHTVQEFKAPNASQRLRVIAESGVDPGTAATAC